MYKRQTRIDAFLDRDGRLIRVTFGNKSGSTQFDQVSHSSVQNKTSDPNPPASALVNDQYHFIFETNITSQLIPTSGGRNPNVGPRERRYLTMRVGLK